MPSNGKDFLLGAPPLTAAQSNFGLDQLKSKAEKLAQGIELHKPLAAKDKDAQIKDASTQFEALLLQQMMGAMWSTVPKDGLVSGSREEELYRDMLNEAVAKNTAKGQGIGIKEVIARELQKRDGKK
jgi:Rod binding domain-containing protein